MDALFIRVTTKRTIATVKFPCTITQSPDGRWRAECSDADLGSVSATGNSTEEATRKLEDELRYRLELCPCSGESYRHIEVQIVKAE